MSQENQAQPLTKSAISDPEKAEQSGQQAQKLFFSFFIITISGLGLLLTQNDIVRGDQHIFSIAFMVTLGVSSAMAVKCIVFRVIDRPWDKKDGGKASFWKKVDKTGPGIVANCVILAGFCASFALLVTSLASSYGIPYDKAYGCVRGFGCANIMAVIVTIFFGVTGLGSLICCGICCPCYICALRSSPLSASFLNGAGLTITPRSHAGQSQPQKVQIPNV